jgi:hypothetical protein
MDQKDVEKLNLPAFLTVWGQESTVKCQCGIIPGFRSLS